MRKFSTLFAVIFLLLALTVLFLISYFNLFSALEGNKISQFVFFNSAIFVLLGIFFVAFNDKIDLYIKNYKREKEI